MRGDFSSASSEAAAATPWTAPTFVHRKYSNTKASADLKNGNDLCLEVADCKELSWSKFNTTLNAVALHVRVIDDSVPADDRLLELC
jgi:hypothetical protein